MVKFLNKISSFKSKFWLINLMQMFERLSYAAVVLQMAVYISQKDLMGGLHCEHTTKGTIFFFWAIVQNLTPVFLGGLADRFGRKKMILFSSIFVSIGYLLIGTQREFYPFLIGTIFLGFGLGLYKPAVQGWISLNMNNELKSMGWALNVMLINFAVFFSPTLASTLQSINFSAVFLGSGAVFLMNVVIALFIHDDNKSAEVQINIIEFSKQIFSNLFKLQVFSFVIIMSGFTMIYMQFYETLPNFMIDWVNTKIIVDFFKLPDFMTMTFNLVKMLDFKQLYALNSAIIVLFVVIVSYMTLKIKTINGLILGIFTATIGLWFSGISMNGWIVVSAMILYTFGELITNPKFNEYMESMAKPHQKSMFLGYMNISFAIGLAGGSLLGGWLYNTFSEKSGLAMKYLSVHFPNAKNITHQNAFTKLTELTSLNAEQSTKLLWNNYHPFLIWYVFLTIGLISALMLYFYSKKIFKNQVIK